MPGSAGCKGYYGRIVFCLLSYVMQAALSQVALAAIRVLWLGSIVVA